jgi:hypothetical protein
LAKRVFQPLEQTIFNDRIGFTLIIYHFTRTPYDRANKQLRKIAFNQGEKTLCGLITESEIMPLCIFNILKGAVAKLFFLPRAISLPH